MKPSVAARPGIGDPPSFVRLASHPVRWRLLQELVRSDRAVSELTTLVDEPQSLVSYHLRHLRDGGLVFARRSSADRRDSYYAIDLAACRDALQVAGGTLHPALRLAPVHAACARRSGPRRRPRVLFLCTGNSARSQMAEALLVHRSDHHVEARSAGSHPKALHPTAVRVMAERGVDISGHSTKHLRRFARTRFDQVITLCDRVREVCPEFPRHPTLAHWSIPDPSLEGSPDASYAAFVRTADELEARIAFLLPTLTRSPTQEEPSHV
jgi:protein-tyrosine-phosphatase/DNA-binding transcriptional ArsR family regulator